MNAMISSKSPNSLYADIPYIPRDIGGGRGIRTPEGLAALAVFKSAD
jgi:hypothetical protein